VVIIKKSLLPPLSPPCAPAILRELKLPVPPIILDYSVVAKNNSLYNTLSIFEYTTPILPGEIERSLLLTVLRVYVAGQVLQKLLATFPDKVAGQQIVAERKANLIYAALDAHPAAYKVVPDRSVRSRMNICFRVIKV
jgi:phosphoserine aminotransferase